MKDRLKIPTGERFSLNSKLCDTIRQEVINSGLYYIVPLKKYGYYENGAPEQLAIPESQKKYFSFYIHSLSSPDHPTIGVDMEHLLPRVTPGAEIGLGPDQRIRIEKGVSSLLEVAQISLRQEEMRKFIEGLLSEEDKLKLEFNSFDPNQSYILPASIARVDLLRKEDGELLSCDPNLLPIGYSIVSEISSRVEKASGLPVGPNTGYIEGISRMCEKHPGKINGIVTTLEYPNWPSHLTLTKIVKEKTGKSLHVIPNQALNADGTIDTDCLNEFNRAFGIEEVNSNTGAVPGFVIRYSRETQQFHPETEVVNAPGIRMLETQLWKGLIRLPGFAAVVQDYGLVDKKVDFAKQICVPTLILKRDGDNLLVASQISRTHGSLAILWENLEDRQEILRAALEENNARNTSEKDNELNWYVKTLSTTGKKGVRHTNSGRVDQACKNIKKVLDNPNFNHEGVFLLQPKIRSVIQHDGNEMRAKIDLFITPHTGKTVLADFMATPIEQKSAHGSSTTKLGLVML